MIPHKSVGKMLNLHQFLSLILLSSSFSVSSDTHSIGKVLLVSHYQYHAITEFVFSPNPPEFIMYLFNPISSITINNKYQSISVLEVVSIQWTLKEEKIDT